VSSAASKAFLRNRSTVRIFQEALAKLRGPLIASSSSAMLFLELGDSGVRRVKTKVLGTQVTRTREVRRWIASGSRREKSRSIGVWIRETRSAERISGPGPQRYREK
jgi:hypothetical protein